MKNKKYLVLWSGGADSTYLIHKLLNEGHEVDACYIEVINNEHKVKRELKAIEDMVPFFNAYPHFNFRGTLIKSEYSCYNDNLLNKQPMVWLHALIMAADTKYDAVAIGYIMNDDTISFLDDMKNFYEASLPFMDKYLPELEFPLSKVAKCQIFEALPDSLMQYVTTCESRIEWCGECTPCAKQKYYELRGYVKSKFIKFPRLKYEDSDETCDGTESELPDIIDEQGPSTGIKLAGYVGKNAFYSDDDIGDPTEECEKDSQMEMPIEIAKEESKEEREAMVLTEFKKTEHLEDCCEPDYGEVDDDGE